VPAVKEGVEESLFVEANEKLQVLPENVKEKI
jgi:hypothetical protein